jgi:hypothetical protein
MVKVSLQPSVFVSASRACRLEREVEVFRMRALAVLETGRGGAAFPKRRDTMSAKFDEEIKKLPHFGKIAFAARCARIAVDSAVSADWPPLSDDIKLALETVERWGKDSTECRIAKSCFKQKIQLPNDRIGLLVERIHNGLSSGAPVFGGPSIVTPTTLDQKSGTITSLLKAAFETAVSEEPAITGKDDKASIPALRTVIDARLVTRLAHRSDLFESQASESFDALRKHINAQEPRGDAGAVGPEFFTTNQ